MMNYADVPRNMDEALCCLCFPIKIGIWIICLINILEEVFAVPEIFELNSPLYTVCLILSMFIGIFNIYYQFKWLRNDNKESREFLLKAF